MQIFLPYKNVFETAKCLDNRRLNKQITECNQILDAIDGAKAWCNHPITKMYKEHYYWVLKYKEILALFYKKVIDVAAIISQEALEITPYFITDDYYQFLIDIGYAEDPEYITKVKRIVNRIENDKS